MDRSRPYDVVIVGGGFYGCCLALFLRSVTDRILVIEQEGALLGRASRTNQARIHSGFHYPRSFVTALRSLQLRGQFARDFAPAVVDDFQMLYAIARRRSKVSAKRFHQMFANMAAPIAPASDPDRALFDAELIEDVFQCDEFAFDWRVLRDMLADRMAAAGIDLCLGARAEQIEFRGGRGIVTLDQGGSVSGNLLFNVTYAGLNTLLSQSRLAPLMLKHELAELVLVAPPPDLRGKAVTVMDGPFFSIMPYPSRGLHSLTHVRYTPHASWMDDPTDERSAYQIGGAVPRASRWRHMISDAQRYMPSCARLRYEDSLFEVKTVLTHNESDDGRPILLHEHHRDPGFYSVLGGKLDNIYDLFEFVPQLDPRLSLAKDAYLMGRG